MQAVILAAGMGSRLNSMTGGGSKALVDIGGRPLILHTLEALADHGVGPVLVIVGHEADKLQNVIGDRAEVLLNEQFAETNSLYSLWLARDWIKQGPLLLLNCDLFFDPRILGELLNEPGNVVAYDSTSSRGHEQTKVALRQRRVVDIGKDLPAASARGESLGLLKFDAEGTRVMLATAEQLIADGHENAWVIEATRIACRQVTLFGLNVAGYPWAEIDFPYDLDVARREVWPLIYRSRWRRHVLWQRTRWAVLAAAVAIVALAGWYSNSRLGPASVDWETADMDGGERIRVVRAAGEQRWWLAPKDSQVVARVGGPEADVQLRLVHPDGAADTLRFVVALSVDDRPVDWRAITSIRDTAIHYGQTVFGDRDRIRLELGPGTHRIGVTLVAGHGDRLLVRIRQPVLREE
jgi:choline kinase